MMSDTVWGNLTQEELNRQYDQSTLVPNVDALMEVNAKDSAKIRSELDCIQNVSYGPTVMERLDIFRVATKGAPVAIYHHGGAWTRYDKDRCSYIAPSLVAAGVNVLVLEFALAPKVSLEEIIRQNRAAICWAWHNADEYGWDSNLSSWRGLEYDKDRCSYIAPSLVAAGVNVLVLEFALAPKVSLEEIIRQNRAAICWAWHNADEYGWDRNRIHSLGHSSGGHICGMMLVTNWEDDYALPMNIIKSAVSCSGIYELEPVRLSHRNTYLDLTEQSARRNSPIRRIPENDIPLTMAWGTGELLEFQRQSREFAVAWTAAGHTVDCFVLDGMHHFEVGREIVNPDYPVLANILKNIKV